MKKNVTNVLGTVLCLLILGISSLASAQVVINPHPITGFQFGSKDILNFDVIYSPTESVKVQYEASLFDGRGQLVVQYVSGVHTLKTGANSYQPTSYNIQQTRYLNQQIAEVERLTSFVPSGDYTYCINMRCVDDPAVCDRTVKMEVDYSACNDVRAESITPLLLSFPEDEAKLKNKRPTFTWIPPMPIGNNPNLTYTYSLVKMLEGQTAEDAIRRNRALYTQSGLRSISLMFPNQLNDLEVGAHYAWQVSAELGDLHIATSDVWEFEIEEEEVKNQFYRLQNHPSGYIITQLIDEPLRLSYSTSYKHNPEENIQIRLVSDTREVELNTSSSDGLVKRGVSTLIIYVGELGFEPGEEIFVVVIDQKNAKQYIKVQLQDE
jgi:hypothetical protein